MPLNCSKFCNHFYFTQNKNQVPCGGLQGPAWSDSLFFLWPPLIQLTLLTLLQSHWLPFCSLNTPGYSLELFPWLFPLPWISFDLTFSMRPVLTNQINTITCPPLDNSDPLYTPSFFSFFLNTYYPLIFKIIYFFITVMSIAYFCLFC